MTASATKEVEPVSINSSKDIRLQQNANPDEAPGSVVDKITALKSMLSTFTADETVNSVTVSLVRQVLAELMKSEAQRENAESKLEVLRKEQDTLKTSNKSLISEINMTREQTSAQQMAFRNESPMTKTRQSLVKIKVPKASSSKDALCGIVDVVSCSSVGRGFSSVFSYSAVPITPVHGSAANQLVSTKLQSFFGVQFEEEKSAVRHFKSNKQRHQQRISEAAAAARTPKTRTPKSRSTYKQRFFGVANNNSNSARTRHLQSNQQRNTWTTSLQDASHEQFAIENCGFPDTQLLGQQISSLSAKANQKPSHMLKNRTRSRPRHTITTAAPHTRVRRRYEHPSIVHSPENSRDDIYDGDYDIDEDALFEQNTPRNTALTAQRLLSSNELNELVETELAPLSPHGPLDLQLLLTSLDALDRPTDELAPDLLAQSEADLLLQSADPRFLSPRSSGCNVSPAYSNSQRYRSQRKVSNARDSMIKLKKTRSNSARPPRFKHSVCDNV